MIVMLKSVSDVASNSNPLIPGAQLIPGDSVMLFPVVVDVMMMVKRFHMFQKIRFKKSLGTIKAGLR